MSEWEWDPDAVRAAMEPRINWFCTGRRDGGHDRVVPDALAYSFPHVPGRRGGGVTIGFEYLCPVCGEGPKRIGKKVRQQIADAGLAEFDISVLPF